MLLVSNSILRRNIICSKTQEGQTLQLLLTLFLLSCSFDASSWRRFHEPSVFQNSATVLLQHLRDGPVFAFIFSFPHISVSGGVLVQLEKLLRTGAVKKKDSSGYLSLPTVTLLPPGESTQSKGGIRERGWWESVCATFLSVYKSRSLLEKHMKSTSDTPWFFSLPSSSSSALPFSLCQIFKVCDQAVVIYSSPPFCPSDSVQSIAPFQCYTHSSWVISKNDNLLFVRRCYSRNMTKKLKK